MSYDDAIAQGFADCEALVVAMLTEMAVSEGLKALHVGRAVSHCLREQVLREAALAVSLGQHRSAETNVLAVLSAHRTAVNRAQAQAAGRASAAKRWGPKGAKSS